MLGLVEREVPSTILLADCGKAMQVRADGGRRILTESAAVGCYPTALPAKPRPQHEDMPSANAIPAWLGVGQAGPGLSAASPLWSVGTRARNKKK